ncbi:MAG: M14 metallopeptidase family protein [Gemmatimonadota bacterium]
MRTSAVRSALIVGVLLPVALLLPVEARSQAVDITNLPTPTEFFGHQPGADSRIMRWDRIAEYFRLLGEETDRIEVEELGKTTRGNPFLLVTISSPANLARKEEYKEIARRLAHGSVSEEEARRLAEEGKTIALITASMHATELGPTQMSPELGYILATEESPEIQAILDDVIFLFVPSWNPDGNIMIADWYRENLGTPYENAPMPWLYHHYVGHDNNRDSFMQTQIETRYVTDILYHEWFPQLFMDMHQMGNSDARLFLSPLYDPRHHSLDPLLTREIELTGAYMRTLLEEKGKIGVIHYAAWNHWRMSAIHTNSLWHNVNTILFEAASASLATPIFQDASELGVRPGLGKTLGNVQTINYPSPWPGGWWRLRDIVEYARWSAIGFLEAAALHKDRYLMNMYRMARNSIEKGQDEPPYAYLVPAAQKDPNTAAKMVNTLIAGGIEFQKATAPFQVQDREFPAGTYVALASQPYRPYLIDMMGPQLYPDRREYPGGPPEATFDITGWTLPYQMGVEALRVDFPFEAQLSPIQRAEAPAGTVSGDGDSYFLDHDVLDSYRAVNRLLDQGADVGWATTSFTSGGTTYPAGTVVASGEGIGGTVRSLAEEFSLQVRSGSAPDGLMELAPLRLGLYKPWTANMDEGWTRWIFETWEFPFTTLQDAEIRNGRLEDRYDVIVLPNISPESIVRGHPEGTVPSQYAGGIGDEGLAALQQFVQNGGTLVTFNSSSLLPIEHFNVPLTDVSDRYPSTELFLPSAILKVDVDEGSPIGYGMEATANVLSFGSPVFEFLDTGDSESGAGDAVPPGVRVVASYPETNPFMSGRLIGERILRGKPALVEVDRGEGKIIMFGFRPQNRAQTHGTFMLLFNSLYYGPAVTGAN